MVTQAEVKNKAANLTTDERAAVNTQLAGMSQEDLAKRSQAPAPTAPAPQVWPEPELFAEPAPVVETPQAPEVNDTATIQRMPEKPVETNIQPIKPIKTEDPVQKVQEVKNQAIINEADEKALKEQNKAQVTNDFTQMLQSGASTKELATFANQNIQFKDSLNSAIRTQFKNQANTKFFGKYNGMSNEDMYSAVKNGAVTIGSERYNMLSEAQRQSFESYKKVQDAGTMTPTVKEEVFDGTTPENTVDFQTIESFIGNMFSNDLRTKLEEARNDSRVVDLSTQLNQKASELELFDIKNIKAYDKLEKELGNSGYTPAYINARVSDLQADNAIIRMSMVSEYNRVQWDLASIKDDIETDLEMYKLEDAQNKEKYSMLFSIYESRRGERLASEAIESERAYNKELTAEEREYQEQRDEFLEQNKILAEQRQQAFTKEMAAIQQEYTEKNQKPQYMTDKNGNLLAIQDGKATKVMDSAGQVVAITKEKDYTDSTSYNAEMWQYVTTRTYDNWNKPDFFVNDITGNSNTSMAVFEGISKIEDYAPRTPRSKSWGGLECWEAANNYLMANGITNIRMEDSFESKVKYADQSYPQVWGLAVWNAEYTDAWHVGIVTGLNRAEWTVEITDYNRDNDWQKNTYTIPISQVVNSDGGFVHLDIQGEDTSTWMSFSQEVQDWGDNIINEVWGSKITGIKDPEMRSQVQSYMAQKMKNEPNQNIETLKSKLTLIEELEAHPWLSGAVGMGSKWLFPWSDSASFMAKLEQLDAVNFMQGIQSMKWMWSLSNAEGSRVSASISSISNTWQSEEAFMKELAKIKKEINWRIAITEEEAGVRFDQFWRAIIEEETDTEADNENTGWMSEMEQEGVLNLTKLSEMYKSSYTDTVEKYNYLD